METIKVIAGEDYPDLSGIPKADEIWNAHITNISDLGHVHAAGCVTPKINIMECYLVVFIGPNTTRNDIIQNWEAIKEIRDKLAAYQGSLPKKELPYRQTAYTLHNEFNLGYGEISKLLNFEILALVLLGLGKEKELGRVAPIEGYYDDIELLLSSFGISETDIKVIKSKAIEDLKSGNISWNPSEYPISPEMVRESIRSFSKLVTGSGMSLERKLTRSLRILESGKLQSAIMEIVLKAYPSDRRKILRYSKKWMRLIILMVRDNLVHQKEYYIYPATMGDLDQFFP